MENQNPQTNSLSKTFPVILTALVFLVVGALGGYMIRGNTYSPAVQQAPQATPTIAVPVTPAIDKRIDPNVYNMQDELNGFPVYPNSLFINKQYYPPCDSGKQSGYSLCNSFVYTWETRDTFNQVDSWFIKNKSQSGWKCIGGGGQYAGPQNASGTTSCTKSGASRGLTITADSIKTSIMLAVPTSEYKGKYF